MILVLTKTNESSWKLKKFLEKTWTLVFKLTVQQGGLFVWKEGIGGMCAVLNATSIIPIKNMKTEKMDNR